MHAAQHPDNESLRAFDAHLAADAVQRQARLPAGPKPGSVSSGQVWGMRHNSAPLPLSHPIFF